MAFTNIVLEKDKLIGTFTLNRPEKLNAMSPPLIAEFAEALVQIERDAEIKVVVIRGAGRASRPDTTWAADGVKARSKPLKIDDDQRFLQRYIEHWLRLRDLPKPVISMVHRLCRRAATNFVSAAT